MLATRPGSHKEIPLDGTRPGRGKKEQHRETFSHQQHPKKQLCVCLVKQTRVTHHDICYAVEEGSYSEAENHLLYGEIETKT